MSTYSPPVEDVKAFREEHGVGLNDAFRYLLKQNLLEATATADLDELRDIVKILIEEVL